MSALHTGFQKMEELGANRKALIFTESTRTQLYLKQLLEENGYMGKIVLFNGSNNDETSRKIYKAWKERNIGTSALTPSLSANKRQAIVDYFRDEAEIMIATEAASEGINLQFCSLIVNYDLPWNPQRVEQRIGRCHRYGQKNDVVVFNFINKANAADVRVFQLLSEKFHLFDGVFGSSDECWAASSRGLTSRSGCSTSISSAVLLKKSMLPSTRFSKRWMRVSRQRCKIRASNCLKTLMRMWWDC